MDKNLQQLYHVDKNVNDYSKTQGNGIEIQVTQLITNYWRMDLFFTTA